MSNDISANLTLLSSSIEAMTGGAGSLTGTLPLFTTNLSGGAYNMVGTLPSITGSFTADRGVIGTIGVNIRSKFSASFEGIAGTTGDMAGIFQPLSFQVLVVQPRTGEVTVDLPKATFSCTGLVGRTASMAVNVPHLHFSSHAFSVHYASLAGRIKKVSAVCRSF